MNTAALYTAFYVIGAVSMIASSAVSVALVKMGCETLTSKLVLCLHLTLILEELASLPVIYIKYPVLCSIFGFVGIFSSVSNCIVMFYLVLQYRYVFLSDTWNILYILEKRVTIFATAFPCVLISFAFINDCFGNNHNRFCSYRSTSFCLEIWATMYTSMITLLLIISTFLMTDTIIKVCQFDSSVAKSLFSSLFMYIFVTILRFLPIYLSYADPNELFYYAIFLAIYISGLLYTVIFLTERRTLAALERNFNISVDDCDAREGNDRFSWDMRDSSAEEAARNNIQPRDESTTSSTQHPVTRAISSSVVPNHAKGVRTASNADSGASWLSTIDTSVGWRLFSGATSSSDHSVSGTPSRSASAAGAATFGGNHAGMPSHGTPGRSFPHRASSSRTVSTNSTATTSAMIENPLLTELDVNAL
jgi:hypothetical protein